MFRSSDWFCRGFYANGILSYGGIFMMVLGLVLIIAVIWFIYKGGTLQKKGGGETPMDILQKRFINGEISREEFEEKKKVIK